MKPGGAGNHNASKIRTDGRTDHYVIWEIFHVLRGIQKQGYDKEEKESKEKAK
jgi:hypothetical protein